MIFAHAYLGVFIEYFLERNFKIKNNKDRFLLWIVSIISAVFPDLDMAFLFLTDISKSHRLFFTHTPIFYGIIGIIAAIIILIKKPKPLNIYLTASFLLGAFIHIIFDAFVDAIYPFIPFNQYKLILGIFPIDKTLGFYGYVKSPYFATELLIIISSLLLLTISYRKNKGQLKWLLSLLAIITLTAAVALIPFLSKFN